MFTYLKRVTALVLLLCATVISTTAVAGGNATPMKFVGTFYGENNRIVSYN